MSGFFGMVRADGGPVPRDLLERIARALAFRGPDSTSICVQEGAGFSFTFLQTGPAPQSRAQPCTLDGDTWLIGDVRLDGREKLAAALEAAGEDATLLRTDEELVLHSWRAWGENAPERLHGDFAFAVWEHQARRLSCFRDLIGIRPFFYAHGIEFLAFSNTLDVLRLVPGVDLSLDDAWVGDFLLQGYSSYVDRTVYGGVRRLHGGHKLCFERSQVHVACYDRLPVEEPLSYRHGSEYVEQFRELLTRAVRDRLPDGPVASFMSGGLDSTSVTAIAAKLLGTEAGQRLRAYTMDLSSALPDEEPLYAKQAAHHVGIPLELLPLGDQIPYSAWADPALRAPEPNHEPFRTGNLEMYERIASFSRVVLSGDGGDNLLTGQAIPYLRYALKKGRIGHALGDLGGSLYRTGRLPSLGTGVLGRWRKLRAQSTTEHELPAWLDHGFTERLALRARSKELGAASSPGHPLHPGSAALSDGYWASVMEEEDAASVGTYLERRSPFLDRRIVEFLLRVPSVPWLMHKELLRQAMANELPRSVRRRAKAPLVDDPVTRQIERLGWRAPAQELHPITARYIEPEKWQATFAGTKGSNLINALRPVSLSYWLKAVENHASFG